MKLIVAFIVNIFCFTASGYCSSDSLIETSTVLHTSTGDIHGTLLAPADGQKIPVALIIAGSGPTDRDGNNPFAMNGALKKLADSLASHHIASLRYDKRGIRESAPAGKNEIDLRFDDYVNDAKGWIDLLKKDQRFSRVVVIGHSEGSLIGMFAAEKADMYVSIAGAGRPADELLKEQLKQQPQYVQDIAFPIIDSLKKGVVTEDVDPMLAALFRTSVQPYLISWFKYDPQARISMLRIPVLIIQGTNDIQVTVVDAKLLAKARPDATLMLVENMNHVLRIVEGDRIANIRSYGDSVSPVSTVLIKEITDFINK